MTPSTCQVETGSAIQAPGNASFNPDGIPLELRAYKQWVVWKLVQKQAADGSFSFTKPPFDPRTGLLTDAFNASTWCSWEEALSAYESQPGVFGGLGFVFTDDDPFVFTDFDHCLTDTGAGIVLIPEVAGALRRGPSYTEESVSATGLHKIIRGKKPNDDRKQRKQPWGGKVEIYQQGRFCAMTGHVYLGHDAISDDDGYLAWAYETFLPAKEEQKARQKLIELPPITKDDNLAVIVAPAPRVVPDGEAPLGTSCLDDTALLERARSQPPYCEEFRRLYDEGNFSGYPGPSEARMVLCNRLAFWANGDQSQVARLLAKSALISNYPTKESGDAFRVACRYDIGKACTDGRSYFNRIQPAQSAPKREAAPAFTPALPDLEAPDLNALNAKLARMAQTELGNAERFTWRHGKDLRYSELEKCWYIWDGRVWSRQDGHGKVLLKAMHTVRAIGDEADAIPVKMEVVPKKKPTSPQREREGEAPPGEAGPVETADANTNIREALLAHGRRSEARQALMNMTALASCLTPISVEPDAFDQHPMLLAVENGVLDLEARKLIPHDRSHLLTTYAPMAFDRNATCPIWNAFLEKVLPVEDVRNYLQTFLGYCLTGETKTQEFLFFYGEGQNGKGTIMDTMAWVLGSLHARIRPEVISSGALDAGQVRFGLAAIMGKRFVTFGELPARLQLNEAMLKGLTGQDPVEIERKNSMAFNYNHRAKFLLAGNHKPALTGTDKAVWRRIRLIPFQVNISEGEKDEDLREKLKLEGSGILNWLLAGLRTYQTEGLKAPDVVRLATKDYQEENDTIGQFLGEFCDTYEVEKCAGATLYTAYKLWMEENGQSRIILSNVKFAKLLTERGFKKDKEREGNVWVGVGLKVFVQEKMQRFSERREKAFRLTE